MLPTPSASNAVSIRSEVGRLRTVLVHRPGIELQRITPTNMQELLFDELVWLERAAAEHDAFAGIMRDAGVEVLFLTELLADILADEGARREVVPMHATKQRCGPTLVGRVQSLLLDLSPADLADSLIGGVTVDDVGPGQGLVATVIDPHEPLLAPLPNTVFMRDSSAWVGEGVLLSSMNRVVRRRETDLLRYVYSHHPRFDGARVWFGEQPDDYSPATFEGGDVLVIGERGLAIGMSERTTPQGAEVLARRLFREGVVDRVLAVDLPKVRAAMHLDTVVTMVDRDAFIVYPSLIGDVRSYQVTADPSGPGVSIREASSLAEGLAWAAGIDQARIIAPDLSSVSAAREQWNDANNTFALAPGEVIAYERNVATNEILSDAGVTVHTMPSYELPRGRGGPRCMSCPVLRDPV